MDGFLDLLSCKPSAREHPIALAMSATSMWMLWAFLAMTPMVRLGTLCHAEVVAPVVGALSNHNGIAAGEPLLRYHVNGGQFIDERVATYSAATGEFTYYLAGDLYSVIGTGNASASDIRRLEYAASGDVIGCLRADANCDGLVNNFDIDPFVAAIANPNSPTRPAGYSPPQTCWNRRYCWADVNGDGRLDNFDIDPFVGCLFALGCGENAAPPGGTPTLHGRPLDVIPAQVGNPRDLVLLNGRPRSYDVRHGRWLQRDRGYRDGGNLYEAFRGNAGRFRDPYGMQSEPESGFERFLASISLPEGLAWEPEDWGLAAGAAAVRRAFARLLGAVDAAPAAVQASLPTAAGVRRTTLGLFRDDVGRYSDADVVMLLQREGEYTGPGLLVWVANAQGLPSGLLPEPLAGAVGPEARYELLVLGPTKGAALAMEGGVQIVTNTADLALRGSLLLASDIGGFGLEPENLPQIIPTPQFVSNNLFFPTPGGTADTSRVLGGNSIVFLAGTALGPGELGGASPGIRYGALDELGRATGVEATLTREALHLGTRASRGITPSGFVEARGYARAHLLGRQLGGSGSDARNLVTLIHNPANSPAMRGFENTVRQAMTTGETVQYMVTPVFRGTELIPRGITIRASGDQGFVLYVTVVNR